MSARRAWTRRGRAPRTGLWFARRNRCAPIADVAPCRAAAKTPRTQSAHWAGHWRPVPQERPKPPVWARPARRQRTRHSPGRLPDRRREASRRPLQAPGPRRSRGAPAIPRAVPAGSVRGSSRAVCRSRTWPTVAASCRVSSAATSGTARSTSTARRVMSPRLPIGVATTYSAPRPSPAFPSVPAIPCQSRFWSAASRYRDGEIPVAVDVIDLDIDLQDALTDRDGQEPVALPPACVITQSRDCFAIAQIVDSRAMAAQRSNRDSDRARRAGGIRPQAAIEIVEGEPARIAHSCPADERHPCSVREHIPRPGWASGSLRTRTPRSRRCPASPCDFSRKLAAELPEDIGCRHWGRLDYRVSRREPSRQR